MMQEWRKTMNRHEETELFLNEQEAKVFLEKIVLKLIIH